MTMEAWFNFSHLKKCIFCPLGADETDAEPTLFGESVEFWEGVDRWMPQVSV